MASARRELLESTMSWPEDFHPEVGYLLPSMRVRKLIRSLLLAACFGVLVGIGGTLALLAPHGEKPTPNTSRLTSAFLVAEQGPAEAVASGPVTTEVADTSDNPVALRRFWPTGRPRALCSLSTTHQACSFHRNGHTDVAAALGPGASPAITSSPSKGVDDATQGSKRPQKPTVTQARKQRPAPEPSDYPRVYASPGMRYGERAYFDRGGFW
jgi:hypothetical protein